MAAPTSTELRAKVAEYGGFISKTLRPQLEAAVDAREETVAEISEYNLLRNKLRSLQAIIASDPNASVNALVDVAHGALYCNAEIPNPRTVYVDVGFGFHVEMTLPEATAFVDKRVKYLEEQVLRHRAGVAERVAKDVEGAMELLEELGEELAEMEGGGSAKNPH